MVLENLFTWITPKDLNLEMDKMTWFVVKKSSEEHTKQTLSESGIVHP